MMKKYLFILPLVAVIGAGCQKFLDAKPNQQQLLPADNLQNLQLLLDDTYTMTQNVPSAGEQGTENVLLSDNQFQGLKQVSETSANLYIWDKNLFNDNDSNDWTLAYNAIFNANLVLAAVDKVSQPGQNGTEKNAIKGSALFFRAFYNYALLQEFAKPYSAGSSGTDPGIVLRLNADINKKSTRSTVNESYAQVINDLNNAISLLPDVTSFNTRPNKAAAVGLLARTYLSMNNYPLALQFAKQYINLSPGLLDYNTRSLTASYPMTAPNIEISFFAKLNSISAYNTTYGRVNDSLLMLYDINDLRLKLFFKNGGTNAITFKGSYYGSRYLFAGVATDEVYLIAAECYARTNDVNNAMLTLNSLLVNRWQTGTFTPYTASDQQSALTIILNERRKELPFRNIRWSDLRRLNQEADFKTTLYRLVNAQAYTLLPNDSRYVLPIPLKVIQLSGITQNP